MAYSKDPETRFFIGSIEVDATLGTAKAGGEILPLGQKVVATLVALCARSGEVVSKATLLAATWGEAAVDDSSLWQNIHVLRGVLARYAPGARIETVKGRGYCLRPDAPAAAPAAPASRLPQRYWPVAAALLLGLALGGLSKHAARKPHAVIFLTNADTTSLPPLPPLSSIVAQ